MVLPDAAVLLLLLVAYNYYWYLQCYSLVRASAQEGCLPLHVRMCMPLSPTHSACTRRGTYASVVVYWTPISNPLTLWERGYVGVPGISLSLYLILTLVLHVCIHTCMTSTMLRPLASYTHTLVPIADVHTSILVLLPRLSFSVYVYHTYLYTYLCMCTCVPYSTRSVPHHTVPQYWYSATYTYTCVFPSIHIVYILVQA